MSQRFFILSTTGFVITIIIVINSSGAPYHNLLSKHRLQVGVKEPVSTHPSHDPVRPTFNMTSMGTKPKTNVVFLKVHKAGSSTMQNIFLRFALAHQLNVILTKPTKKIHLNEHDYAIKPYILIPVKPGSTYNILAHHILFNKREISRFFPSNTVYIGIIREPFAQFASSLYYFGTQFAFLKGIVECVQTHSDPVSAFLRHPKKYDIKKTMHQSFVNNRMSRDFGMPFPQIEQSRKNHTIIKEFIYKVRNEFDLILVMEYFDASVVLMRRFLNWTFKDIVYSKINEYGSKVKVRTGMNEINKSRHKKYAPSDHALYEYFLSIFLNTIESLGKDFIEEVEAFRGVQLFVKNFCNGITGRENSTILHVEGTKWSQPFQVSSDDCRLMKLNEIEMTHTVRVVQEKRYSQ